LCIVRPERIRNAIKKGTDEAILISETSLIAINPTIDNDIRKENIRNTLSRSICFFSFAYSVSNNKSNIPGQPSINKNIT
jgi:hypothetical protein